MIGGGGGGSGSGAVVHFVLDTAVSGAGLFEDERLLGVLGADGGHALHLATAAPTAAGVSGGCGGSGVERAGGSGEASGRIETSEWCERRGRLLGVPNRNDASPRLTGELQLRQGRRTVGRSGGREARRREEGGGEAGERTRQRRPPCVCVRVRAAVCLPVCLRARVCALAAGCVLCGVRWRRDVCARVCVCSRGGRVLEA